MASSSSEMLAAPSSFQEGDPSENILTDLPPPEKERVHPLSEAQLTALDYWTCDPKVTHAIAIRTPPRLWDTDALLAAYVQEVIDLLSSEEMQAKVKAYHLGDHYARAAKEESEGEEQLPIRLVDMLPELARDGSATAVTVEETPTALVEPLLPTTGEESSSSATASG